MLIPESFIISFQSSEVKFFNNFLSFFFFTINDTKVVPPSITEEIAVTLIPSPIVGLCLSIISFFISLFCSFILFFSSLIVLFATF